MLGEFHVLEEEEINVLFLYLNLVHIAVKFCINRFFFFSRSFFFVVVAHVCQNFQENPTRITSQKNAVLMTINIITKTKSPIGGGGVD